MSRPVLKEKQLTELAGSRLNGLIGARSQMASIITSICMILSIFFLLPYLYFLPKVSRRRMPKIIGLCAPQAVLAAIICLVVYARELSSHDNNVGC